MCLCFCQKIFVECSVVVFVFCGNMLGVVFIGVGKIIMFLVVIGEMIGDGVKVCVFVYCDELMVQNCVKFQCVVLGVVILVIDVMEKLWGGQVVFVMVLMLVWILNFVDMLCFDLLVVDEVYYVVVDSYCCIIDWVCEVNFDVCIFGVMVMLNWGDKKGLCEVFDNVVDQVWLGELIVLGYLVLLCIFVIDVGVQDELCLVCKMMLDFDMVEVVCIMDCVFVIDEVIWYWKEKVGDWQMVVFCFIVVYVEYVIEVFRVVGVFVVLIYGDLVVEICKVIFVDYVVGDICVIVNVVVLIEGWDYLFIFCVVLLWFSFYKFIMIQMVGCGLCIVDFEEYFGIVKIDCVVLDFGMLSLIYGMLEQEVDFDGKIEVGEVLMKFCFGCGVDILLVVMECLFCGEVFLCEDLDVGEGDGVVLFLGFMMMEIDLLKWFSFVWVDFYGMDDVLMVMGFVVWGGIFWLDGVWYVIGGVKGECLYLLGVGECMVCFVQVDDWLNMYEIDESVFKICFWFCQLLIEKQLQYLLFECCYDFGLMCYCVFVLMIFGFNKCVICQLIDMVVFFEWRVV